jgi:hypothetical protein
MIIVEVGGDSMSCLPRRRRRSVLPSPPGAMGNPSMGLPVMVHYRSGGLPWAGPITMALEPPPRGERLRPLNRSMTNSILPKRMVLPRGKPSPGGTLTSGNGDEHQIQSRKNDLRKSTLQIPLLGTPTVGGFCTSKI